MSQTRPFRQDVNWIKGDTLQYQFTFNEDDSALDLSGKDEITVILRNRNSTIFTHTLTGGQITISGAGNNIISGEASSTVMDIASRSYDLIIFFDNDIKQTWVMFDVTIFDENSELNSSASEWTIDIDTTSGAVEGQAAQQITAPTFSFSQDSVPDSLIEGAFAVVNGVTYVGNSNNEPVKYGQGITPPYNVNVTAINENHKHKGLSSDVFEIDDMWIVWYREGNEHGVDVDSYIKIIKSFDNGATWESEEIIYNEAGVDARNGCSAVMNNGRLGIVLDRRSDADRLPPVFLYSDDDGDNWSSNIIGSPDSFAPFHRILSYPASVGGNDDNGYICYGSEPKLGNPKIVYLSTTDNGDNWSSGTALSSAQLAGVSNVSEPCVERLGSEDKWIMVIRNNDEYQRDALISKSTDLTTWDDAIESGKVLSKNPPYIYYNDGNMYFVAPSRIRDPNNNYIDLKSNVAKYMICEQNANVLFNDLTKFGDWRVWFNSGRTRLVGYITMMKSGDEFYGVFCNSEPLNADSTAQLNLLSTRPFGPDFETPSIPSGYSPTITNESNVTSYGTIAATYNRVGRNITVDFSIADLLNTATGDTSFNLNIPTVADKNTSILTGTVYRDSDDSDGIIKGELIDTDDLYAKIKINLNNQESGTVYGRFEYIA